MATIITDRGLVQEIFPGSLSPIEPYENPTPAGQDFGFECIELKSDIVSTARGSVDIDSMTLGAPVKLDERWRFAVSLNTVESTWNFIEWFDRAVSYIAQDGILGLRITNTKTKNDISKDLTKIEDILIPWINNSSITPASLMLTSALIRNTNPELRYPGRSIRDSGFVNPDTYKEYLVEKIEKIGQVERTDGPDNPPWHFTPSSFLSIIEDISKLGLFRFRVDAVFLNKYSDENFVVYLRPALSIHEVLVSISNSRRALEDSLEFVLLDEERKAEEIKSALLSHFAQARLIQLTLLQGRYDALNDQLAAAKLEIDRLQYTISSMDAIVASARRDEVI